MNVCVCAYLLVCAFCVCVRVCGACVCVHLCGVRVCVRARAVCGVLAVLCVSMCSLCAYPNAVLSMRACLCVHACVSLCQHGYFDNAVNTRINVPDDVDHSDDELLCAFARLGCWRVLRH